MAAGNGSGFESGVNGDALTTTNSGVDTVTLTSGTGVISTAQSAHGTRSALFTAGSASGATYISKTITATDTITVRVYARFTAYPTGTLAPCLIWLGNGSSQLANLEVTASGNLRIRDDASANAWTSTMAMSLNTWYRIEFSILRNATTGTARATIYTLDGTTALEDSTTLTSKNTGSASVTTIRIGAKTSTGTMETAVFIDDWDYDPTTTVFIGPVTEALVAPTVSLGVKTNPSTIGGSNGTQTVTWSAVTGATSYEAWIANSASPSQGDFTLVATGVTSPYTFTGIAAGTRAFGIKAKA